MSEPSNPDLENPLPENTFKNNEIYENPSDSRHNTGFILNEKNLENEGNPCDFLHNNGFLYNYENLENAENPIEDNALFFERIDLDEINVAEVPHFEDF